MIRIPFVISLLVLVSSPCTLARHRDQPVHGAKQNLDSLLKQSDLPPSAGSPGSLYYPGGRLSDLARDLRASQVHDLVTILVDDRASAVSTGTTNTSRKSSANASITSLAKQLPATSAWTNLANLGGNQQLQGQGTTSRDSTLTTTLSAEVGHVFPNGNLLIEGRKELYVNGEHQTVTARGIVRPDDLSPTNSIASDRIANLEILVNGKGIVSDSVRRPFILYRLLLGLLPF